MTRHPSGFYNCTAHDLTNNSDSGSCTEDERERIIIAFTPEQREQIANDSKGKVVESLEWDEIDEYWVMTFTDGSETSFRFMAELS